MSPPIQETWRINELQVVRIPNHNNKTAPQTTLVDQEKLLRVEGTPQDEPKADNPSEEKDKSPDDVKPPDYPGEVTTL